MAAAGCGAPAAAPARAGYSWRNAGQLVGRRPVASLPRRPAAARALLVTGSTVRKLHLRGLAIEEIARSKQPWAISELQTLRSHRRGREFLDVIDQALAAQ